MAVRFYPNPEGYHAPSGTPYKVVPTGFIRVELDDFIEELQKICREKELELIITSLNHGDHVGNSMHYSGLAIDYNLKDSHGEWVDFKIQAELAVNALDELKYDGWLWVADPDETDPSSHTHCSVHPIDASGITVMKSADE
jgi:hypothetical protein